MGFQFPTDVQSNTLSDVTNSVRTDLRTERPLEDIKENLPSSSEVHCHVVLDFVVSLDIVSYCSSSKYCF